MRRGGQQHSHGDSAQAQGMQRRGGMQHGQGEGMQRRGGMQHGQGEGMQRRGGMRHGQGDAAEGQGMQHGRRGQETPPPVPPELEEGQRLFESICTQCHSMNPPANLAPPITHVARHLRQAFETEDEALDHIRTYIPEPDAERSVLPAMAQERFGLMPPLPLPAELLDAIGRYVWFLGSSEGGGH